jgi:hypothetical protein
MDIQLDIRTISNIINNSGDDKDRYITGGSSRDRNLKKSINQKSNKQPSNKEIYISLKNSYLSLSKM